MQPGGQLAGERDDGAPDLVLGLPVQGKVRQAGVFAQAHPGFAEGPASVTQLEVGELAVAGVCGEPGDPVAVDVGDPYLGPGGVVACG